MDTAHHHRLTRGQVVVLSLASLLMLGTGLGGAAGTYSNITAEFGRAATAIGMVAAGEGATLVLALVMVGLTMLGQSAPAPVRVGLWVVPIMAAVVGLAIADDGTEAVIYGVSPMGMCVSAEGLGLLARRIVVHRTGVDAEAQRRNAETVQRLAYHRARAANHPSERTRRQSELAAWRLAKRVGVGDTELGANLVQLQRERLRQGADEALAGMFTAPVTRPAVTDGATSVTPPVTPGVTPGALEGVTDPVTPGVTQVSPEVTGETDQLVTVPDTGVTQGPAEGVTDPGPEPSRLPAEGSVTLTEVASVAGVETPAPAVTLTDDQLLVVLRWLRYREDPPLSYRQAVGAFRDAGFVGGEKRVRTAWGALLSLEESGA